MSRREVKASTERHAALMAELSQISTSIEMLALASLKPVVIAAEGPAQSELDDVQSDNERLSAKVIDLEGRLRNSDGVVEQLLARAESAERDAKGSFAKVQEQCADLDRWMNQLGAGITGWQPEAPCFIDALLKRAEADAAKVERLQGEVTRLQAELNAARAPASDISLPAAMKVTPAQSDRTAKLKAAVASSEAAQTEKQAKAYGQYIRPLAAQMITAYAIAGRINRELGLEVNALSYHDIKRICAHMGIEVAG